MGGAFRVPGNTTPTTEWNIHCDPEAARIAFAGWQAAVDEDPRVPRALVMGLDVTERARIIPADVAALAARAGSSGDLALDPDQAPDPARRAAASDPVIAFVADALRYYFEFHARYDGFYGAFIHDPLVTAVALDPDLARSDPAAVDVDTSGGLADGQTIADWRRLLGPDAERGRGGGGGRGRVPAAPDRARGGARRLCARELAAQASRPRRADGRPRSGRRAAAFGPFGRSIHVLAERRLT